MINEENVVSKVHSSNKSALSVTYVPPHLRNNKLAIQTYFSSLKDCLECLREIVEEDKLEKPHDNAIGHACLYAKRSQEILECLITICPKTLGERVNPLIPCSMPNAKYDMHSIPNVLNVNRSVPLSSSDYRFVNAKKENSSVPSRSTNLSTSSFKNVNHSAPACSSDPSTSK